MMLSKVISLLYVLIHTVNPKRIDHLQSQSIAHPNPYQYFISTNTFTLDVEWNQQHLISNDHSFHSNIIMEDSSPKYIAKSRDPFCDTSFSVYHINMNLFQSLRMAIFLHDSAHPLYLLIDVIALCCICVIASYLRGRYISNKLFVLYLAIHFVSAQTTVSPTQSPSSSHHITCSDVTPCSSPITCNDNTDCFITCSESYSCESNTINGPISGDLTVICSQTYSCQYAVINAKAPSHNVSVQCATAYACYKATINGPTNGDINVECAYHGACYYATINGPTNGDINVECAYNSACYHATINGPTDGNLMVECASFNSNCGYTNIKCPIHGLCHVRATPATYAFIRMIVNATSMLSGSLLLESGRDVTVYCPGNDNECTIICDDNYACAGSVFHTMTDTAKLDITAKGYQALHSAVIYCPTGNGICSIRMIGIPLISYDVVSGAAIYSQNGLPGLSISCSNDTDSCYESSNPPLLLCKSNYGSECVLSLQNGETVFSSCSSAIACDDNTGDGVFGVNNLLCSVSNCTTIDTITCIENEDCFISCDVSYGCQSKTINGPTNGHLTVTCSQRDSCRYITINTYAPNHNVTIQCTSTNSCRSSTINAHSSYHLHMFCLYSGCQQATINGPTNGDSNVECAYSRACYYATINGPVNGNLRVECGAFDDACQYATIECPIYGICHVRATPATYAFIGMIVNATSMLSGSLLVESGRQVDVYCPGNDNECTIICHDDYGCSGSTFHTMSDTAKLDITAKGYQALHSAVIYCAIGVGICSIRIIGIPLISYDVVSGAVIYSMHGMDGLSMSCDNDTTSCYDPSNPPHLLCKSNYRSKCILSVKNGETQFSSCDNAMLCDDDTVDTVFGNIVLCAAYECTAMPIHCNEDHNCSVICNGSQSCQNAKITAPVTGNISVQCISSQSCTNVYIECPIHGNCYVESPQYTSTEMTIDAEHMLSGGLEVNSATSATIKCPGNGNECMVTCEDEGCLSSTIISQSTTSTLVVLAHGYRALQSAKIYCPTGTGTCYIRVLSQSSFDLLSNTKIYSVNGFNSMSISCAHENDVSSCYDDSNPPRLFCKSNYGSVCNVVTTETIWDEWECDGVSSIDICDESTADGYYGALFVCNDVMENNECRNIVCNNNSDCSVYCTTALSCQSANINGDIARSLSVECLQPYACYDSTIFGPTTGDLLIECRETGSCRDMETHCPMNGECFINAIASNSTMDVMSNMQIYSINGLENVSLVCSYSHSSSYCYNALPQLYCNPFFSAWCPLRLQSSTNQWVCNDINEASDVCLWFTDDPTLGPTSDPTSDPTSEEISTTDILHGPSTGSQVKAWFNWLSTEISLGIIGLLILCLCGCYLCSYWKQRTLRHVIYVQSHMNAMMQKEEVEKSVNDMDKEVKDNVKEQKENDNNDVAMKKKDVGKQHIVPAGSFLTVGILNNISPDKDLDDAIVEFVVKNMDDDKEVVDDDDTPGSLERMKTNLDSEGVK